MINWKKDEYRVMRMRQSTISYLFCSSSLARSSTSSGLSWVEDGVDGERPGEVSETVDDPTTVCSEDGVATWLAI